MGGRTGPTAVVSQDSQGNKKSRAATPNRTRARPASRVLLPRRPFDVVAAFDAPIDYGPPNHKDPAFYTKYLSLAEKICNHPDA